MYSRNRFLVHSKYSPTTDTAYPTSVINCAVSAPSLTTPTGILLDPGGSSNYPASLTCTQLIQDVTTSGSVGYELTFDSFGTEANGDSLIIEDAYGGRIAFSGSTLPPTLLLPSYIFRVTFKSDNDAITGTGFQLRWRKLIGDGGITLFGSSLQFDINKFALVGGLHGAATLLQAGKGATILGHRNSAIGDYATAIGRSNVASYENATAIGYDNSASSFDAIALGRQNNAWGVETAAVGSGNQVDGDYSSALGYYNIVPGRYAIALGFRNTVSGQSATALGFRNVASGANSTALGNLVSTNTQSGAFIIGDNSPVASTSATAINQFTARFANGYRLFTNANTTIGVQVTAGGNAWSAISDSTKKERFLSLNHADLLAKLRTLRLGTWNYKGQRDQRHYGPMAQDFFARFGHDALGVIGCDTLLNSHDFTAVTLSGVQALAIENEQLKTRIAYLEQQAQVAERERTQTTARLEALERAVLVRPVPRTSVITQRKRVRSF